MPDLLAHALLAYGICQILAWRYAWLTAPYRTVGMAGAFVPDLSKVDLLIDDAIVHRAFAVPFDWFALHTSGAVLVSILLGVVAVAGDYRRRVFALLAVGSGSHLLADGLLLTPTGRSYPMFWPLTRFVPPTPGLYLSTDPEPTIVAGLFAFAVWLTTRYRRRAQTS